ncbi:hypothetical protein DCAR_0935104 [Daucus carota subsp. sativus]|uniref:H15 domain-containing protein n=1 Tax=Daucus carota subsp. sativus TaxID=79200 RepID=A0AAF1BG43_DAUCS|nr:PREDICTED: histone H1-like [Daucus carota subsp. sativus]WOH15562.1 hypothetical protein DCAR_0935104 [Daucus carota subsp. sativus]
MDKLKDAVMKLFVNIGPEQKGSIQAHINNFVSDFKPPHHPPYAAMIHRAIEELSERRGSSEDSISQYIRKQYTDLPLAHNSLLKHHLRELSNSGEILMTGRHLYLIPSTDARLEPGVTAEKVKLKRNKKTRRGSGKIGKKYEESDEDEEIYYEESDEHEEKYAEAKGKTGRNDREGDELIGELIHAANPALEFCVTAESDKPKRKRMRRGRGRIGKKNKESDEH